MSKYDRKKADQLDLKNGKSSLFNMPTTEFLGKWIKTHDPYATDLDELRRFEKTPEGREIFESLGMNNKEARNGKR